MKNRKNEPGKTENTEPAKMYFRKCDICEKLRAELWQKKNELANYDKNMGRFYAQ